MLLSLAVEAQKAGHLELQHLCHKLKAMMYKVGI